MSEDRYGIEFSNVTQCDPADQKVLESLRFRDQDACLKGGAVMASRRSSWPVSWW